MHNWEHYSRLPAYFLAAALVASCGGGGDSDSILSLNGQSTANFLAVPTLVAVPQEGATLVTLTLQNAGTGAKEVTLKVSGSATIDKNLVTTDPSTGAATFSIVGTGVEGEGIVTATYTDSGGNIAQTKINYKVVNGANTVSLFSLEPQAFNSALPTTGATTSELTVVLKDSLGKVVQGAVVNFALKSAANNGTISASSKATDATGKATIIVDALNQTAGSNEVIVSYTDSFKSTVTKTIPFSIFNSLDLLLTTTTNELKTGDDSVVLTAVVLDDSKTLAKDKKVTFSILPNEPILTATVDPSNPCPRDVTDPLQFGDNLSTSRVGTLSSNNVLTDVNGAAKVTFAVKDDKNSTRRIVATVDEPGLDKKPIACVDLTLSGTTITLSPLVVNGKTGDNIVFSASAKNGRGSPVAKKDIEFIGAGTEATDVNGVAKKTVTISNNISALDVRSSVLGVVADNVKDATITVSDESIGVSFLGGITPIKLSTTPTTAPTIKVVVKDGVTPIKGKVRLTTTRGTLGAGASNLVLDVNGETATTITSSFPGLAHIDIIVTKEDGTTLTGEGSVQFVATEPAKMTLQAPVSALSLNANTEVEAKVLDANNNPIDGVWVDFNLVKDSSNGRLSKSSVLTDVNGRASVSFIAGGNDVGFGAVEISATVAKTDGTSLTSSNNLKLTVGNEALFVSISTGADIENGAGDLAKTTYVLPLSIAVVDAAGHAVRDTLVALDVIPTEYRKGVYYFDATGEIWVTGAMDPRQGNGVVDQLLVQNAYRCVSEDINSDGFLDTIEDINKDKILWPGNPVIVQKEIRTDDAGRAVFSLSYGKSWANWVSVKLVASTKVAGSEGKVERNFTLPVASDDVDDKDISPPGGVVSPFGAPVVVVTKTKRTNGTLFVSGSAVETEPNPCTLTQFQGGVKEVIVDEEP